MLLNAHVYAKNNVVQQHCVNSVLQKYLKHIQWKENDSILDVGTGDGAVLTKILLPNIPTNLQKIVAFDINQNMINIAQKNKIQEQNIKFMCLDVATSDIPPELHENFNHIFSFYCLMWVSDQKQAIKNMSKMLNCGGDILLSLVKTHAVCHIYDEMNKNSRWSFLMENEPKIFPYHNCTDALQIIRKHLHEAGFVIKRCEVLPQFYVHKNLEEFWNFAFAVNPYVKKVSKDDINDYKRDFLDIFKTLPFVKFEVNSNYEGKIYDNFETIIVVASKP